MNSGFINIRVRKSLLLFTVVQVICAWFATKFMKASKLAETYRIYCFSNTSVDTKILSTFDRVAPVFFRVKIFVLKKTGKNRSKEINHFSHSYNGVQ